jgi:predicted Zn-dependent protease
MNDALDHSSAIPMLAVRSLLASALVCALSAQAQGLPDLGDASDATLSEQQERTIGNRIMREVRVDKDFVDDPEIADYISSLGARLLGASEGTRRDLDFFVVQDDTVNAFALVGGHIGVHSGLVNLTQNESELAGVVAHEIAHILQKHQARMMAGQTKAQLTSLAALAIALLASRSNSSQASQVTEAAVATAGAVSIQSQIDYTREHEREADRVGLTLLERAGYDPRGMASFFERMLRANRLNELKGAPSYLRTHPLTTERIADMQDRLERLPSRLVPDSFDYRLARAKLRAASGSATQAVNLFRGMLEDASVLRPREEVYGLALALRRARDLEGAWKTLAPLRAGYTMPGGTAGLPTLRAETPGHPAFELLAGQILTDMRRFDEAAAVYQAALKLHPGYRSLVYANLELMLQTGRAAEAIADLDSRVRIVQDDARLYELQARAFSVVDRPIAQHRAQAEAHFRRGNLAAAVDQLETAVKQTRGSDFYELSSAESRLRQLRALLETERAAEKALKIS